MRIKRGPEINNTPQAEGNVADNFYPDAVSPTNDKEYVLRCIAEFTESGLGILHRPSDKDQCLYLFTGEAFHLGELGVTKLG